MTAAARWPDLRAPVVAMVATLGSFGSALLLEHAAGADVALSVLAVVLAVTLSRTHAGVSIRRLVTVPVVAVLAGEVARLTTTHRTVGEALFVLGLSVGIWLRRFGPRVAGVGRLVALPFIALLVTPVPAGGGARQLLLEAVMAVVVIGWVSFSGWAAGRAGFLAVPGIATTTPEATAGPSLEARWWRNTLPVSTRMALQMAVALAAAFLVGRVLFPAHVPWVVITAFIVNAGNRGRGDVLHKAALRLAGAGVGTVAATFLGGLFPAHDPVAVAVIFVVLFLAIWLRQASYAYWAAGVTGVLALLYGYYGDGGIGVMGERVGAIGVGAVLGVGAAMFVTPVRTRDVVHRRVTAALVALAAVLETPAGARELSSRRAALSAAIAELDLVAPALEAERRLLRRWRRTPFHADAIDALRRCATQLQAPTPGAAGAEFDTLGAAVATVRRTMAGHPEALAETEYVLREELEALHGWAVAAR